MTTIVTRAGKGSELTHNEVDANFTNLNTDKLEATDVSAVAISGDYADLANIPATFAPSSHTHVIADVTGLQTALDGKQAAGSYQPLATVLTNTTAAFTTAQETKLAGIATGATANSSDATLLNRANHTGTQAASTISDFASSARAETESELVAGTNVTITPSGSGATRQLTIAATGGSGSGISTGLSMTLAAVAYSV